MPNTKGLALEVRLSAYLDGEVDDAERKELENLVSRSDDARRILETLKAGNALGDKALEDVLHDPVPLSLVRHIKQGPGAAPKTERVVATVKKRKTKAWPRLAAAGVTLLLVGGSTGYIVGKTSEDTAPLAANIAISRAWLDDIADAHRIYSRQTAEYQVEVRSTSDNSRMRNWLVSSTGIDFSIPDLSVRNLSFEGARLLVTDGRPTAQLVYKDEDNDVFAICLVKARPGADDSAMLESIRDDIAMIAWQSGGTSYVVVGPSSDANVRQLAEDVASQL